MNVKNVSENDTHLDRCFEVTLSARLVSLLRVFDDKVETRQNILFFFFFFLRKSRRILFRMQRVMGKFGTTSALWRCRRARERARKAENSTELEQSLQHDCSRKSQRLMNKTHRLKAPPRAPLEIPTLDSISAPPAGNDSYQRRRAHLIFDTVVT